MHKVDTEPYSNLAALQPSSPPLSPLSERESTEFKNRVDKIQWITQAAFSSLLNEVKQQPDPFEALENRLSEGKCIVQLDNGASLQCILSTGDWESITNIETQPGDFRYIEVFAYNSATKVAAKKPLISIRCSLDRSKGEWLAIKKGNKVSGSQAKALAEELSSCMQIQECFLADSSELTFKKMGKIALRVPLQVIRNSTFYSKFRLYDTANTPSRVEIKGKKNHLLTFKQDVQYHKRKLKWLQNMTLGVISNKVLINSPSLQKTLATLLERNAASEKTTLQQLMTKLYENTKVSKQAQKDYLWACVHLLTESSIKGESPLQSDYKEILRALNYNMLFVANFR